jgi:glycolate oxidase
MPVEGEDVAPLAARLRREIGPANVLTDRQELRTYECDGLAVYKVMPAIVTLPETREQVRAPGCPAARCRTRTACSS